MGFLEGLLVSIVTNLIEWGVGKAWVRIKMEAALAKQRSKNADAIKQVKEAQTDDDFDRAAGAVRDRFTGMGD